MLFLVSTQAPNLQSSGHQDGNTPPTALVQADEQFTVVWNFVGEKICDAMCCTVECSVRNSLFSLKHFNQLHFAIVPLVSLLTNCFQSITEKRPKRPHSGARFRKMVATRSAAQVTITNRMTGSVVASLSSSAAWSFLLVGFLLK